MGGEVTASTELAGPIELFEQNLTDGAGPSVKLPLRVKLENPVLGEECYVGSDTEPIVLQLTTGTTKPPAGIEPITGKPGTVMLNPAQNIVSVSVDPRSSTTPSRHRAVGRMRRCRCSAWSWTRAVDLQEGLPHPRGDRARPCSNACISSRQTKRQGRQEGESGALKGLICGLKGALLRRPGVGGRTRPQTPGILSPVGRPRATM